MNKCKRSYDLPLIRFHEEKSDTPFSVIRIEKDHEVAETTKYGSSKQSLVSTFRDYCSYTTIHGVRYLGEEGRPCYERIFWILIFIFAIYSCSQLIYSTWDKWTESPVIVSLSEKSTPIWQIPFPAVTICPETKCDRQMINFTKLYGVITANLDANNTVRLPTDINKDEFQQMFSLFQICESYLVESINFERVISGDIINTLDKIAPVFEKTYPFCKWKSELRECGDILSKTITDEGICYTLNGLSASELFRSDTINYNFTWKQQKRGKLQWSLQEGYSEEAGAEPYPERILGAGARPGLFLAIQGFKYDMDYICRGPIQGFKVFLHSPDDIPQMSKRYVRVPFEQEILMSVMPNMIVTSNNLYNYPPQRRQCFFSEERYLRYFQTYTQSNCELECLANYTFDRCGCVKFSMPRLPSTPVCDVSSIRCYEEAENSLLKSEFVEELRGSKDITGERMCNCLPACTSLSYSAETSQAHFDLRSLLQAFNDTYEQDNPGVKMSRLSIFFKENQFLTSKRSELYGVTDFLASCGGLLGLFMGVSAVSLVETTYFYTLRLFTNIRNAQN